MSVSWVPLVKIRFCVLVFSLKKIPEDVENFTITLINATGGARLGNVLNASLQINKNDDPIYFAGKAFSSVTFHINQ